MTREALWDTVWATWGSDGCLGGSDRSDAGSLVEIAA